MISGISLLTKTHAIVTVYYFCPHSHDRAVPQFHLLYALMASQKKWKYQDYRLSTLACGTMLLTHTLPHLM